MFWKRGTLIKQKAQRVFFVPFAYRNSNKKLMGMLVRCEALAH
jgi:hypothetical protein